MECQVWLEQMPFFRLLPRSWEFNASLFKRENTRDRGLITYQFSIHHENLCLKSLKMTNVATLISKLVSFTRSKEMNIASLNTLYWERRCSLVFESLLIQSWSNAWRDIRLSQKLNYTYFWKSTAKPFSQLCDKSVQFRVFHSIL
jgi:hypothetical protein